MRTLSLWIKMWFLDVEFLIWICSGNQFPLITWRTVTVVPERECIQIQFQRTMLKFFTSGQAKTNLDRQITGYLKKLNSSKRKKKNKSLIYALPNSNWDTNVLNLELKVNFITFPQSLALIYYSSSTSEIPHSQLAKVIPLPEMLGQAYHVVSSAYR